ncbi:hypothetical protein FFK22_024565 [Mycobacterium sp. KBS0706]|uniref:hypothetical protein n=1 Tax=Mycobacterium sp. KBS0706 TaxID=2578109 RepID=UPI00110F9606|nr:hypothetical protein [Mycobacterium sp. KBS0706]TSD85997.1 hypothetical protein FFK22_024565 [Mycobacterium sp. KBS0706]
MTMILPEGVRASVRLFLVGAAGEEVTIEVPNLQFLPPIPAPADPAAFLEVCRSRLRNPVKAVGAWRFMTDREVDAFLAREKEDDGFNAHGSGPVQVERCHG